MRCRHGRIALRAASGSSGRKRCTPTAGKSNRSASASATGVRPLPRQPMHCTAWHCAMPPAISRSPEPTGPDVRRSGKRLPQSGDLRATLRAPIMSSPRPAPRARLCRHCLPHAATSRPSPAAAHLGHPDRILRPDHGRARWLHRQYRPAIDLARAPVRAVEHDLGRECLPAYGHGLPAAAVIAGRHPRIQAGLPRGAGYLPGRIAAVRTGGQPAHAGGGARAAGPGRGRHHEREYGAGALYLSAHAPGPWHRPERAGGRRDHRSRPVARRTDPFAGKLAVAVRRQCARGHLRTGAQPQRAA